MGRQSKVKRLPEDERRFIERLLREDRLTLSEMIGAIRAEFPTVGVSRSGLGRYKQQFEQLAGRMRDIQAAGTALVAELGEDPDDRAGQLMVNAVTSLAANAAMQANDVDARDLSLKEITQLAHAARAVMETRKMSLAERQQIVKEAREALQREQREKLLALGQSGAVDAAMLQRVIKSAYGEGI